MSAARTPKLDLRGRISRIARAGSPSLVGVVVLPASASQFESGRVYIKKEANWLADYTSELAAFPGSKYDDQIDSTTQALEFMTGILKPTIYHVL